MNFTWRLIVRYSSRLLLVITLWWLCHITKISTYIIGYLFILYNPIFFILSFFWYNGVLFVNILLCRYSSIRSTCLVLASHHPIVIPRSGRLQGNTFSMHSAEYPAVVALLFPPILYILVSQWLVCYILWAWPIYLITLLNSMVRTCALMVLYHMGI